MGVARAAQPTVPMSYYATKDQMYLSPDEAAEVIGCDPHYIRVMASTSEGREALGFRVIRIGSVTKIPRIPFLRFLGWEGPIVGSGEEASA